ncbi:MAG: hypothetical protein HUK26_08320, partial [Duodenibacillus sp.]|nr:hypothetical protein [Duodenibacillus sp.]
RGLDGFAEDGFRLSPVAVALRYIEGSTLKSLPYEKVTPAFLLKLEALTRAMHARGVAHLDMRSMGNVLMRPDGTPAIIDLQAAVLTEGLPAWLRRILEDIDMSGAYKKWRKCCPEAMDEGRRKELERINRWRRLWPCRGYLGCKKCRRRRV